MVKSTLYPYWLYNCPLCNMSHASKKQDANYMDTWTEICPVTKEPIMIIHETFVDSQTFEQLKSIKKSK